MTTGLDRLEMLRKRGNALQTAAYWERKIHGRLTALTLAVAGVALAVLWARLSAQVIVLLAVCLFVLRWLMNVLVYLLFTKPTMERIGRECPAPPERAK